MEKINKHADIPYKSKVYINACDYYRLKEQNEKLLKALEHITYVSQDKGVEGCTYGDTKYDSMSVVYGYNSCLEQLKDIAFEAIKILPAMKVAYITHGYKKGQIVLIETDHDTSAWVILKNDRRIFKYKFNLFIIGDL